MSVFPAGLCTGMVHGRFIVAVIDGPDDDRDPDVVPARGRIVFRASVEYVTIRTDDGPVTVTLAPIAGVLDDEGYLCTPHPETGEPMYRGVTLTSSDGPGMSVTGWTWSADYRLDPVGTAVVKVPAHSFVLPCGGAVDLGDLVKVPSSPGVGIPQMEAVVLRAEAAAELSSDSASQALLIAQSVRDDADAGLFKGDPGKDGAPGNATLRVDTSVGKRVFISDGTTEHMISGDTGWRNVIGEFAAINDPRYTPTLLRIRRINQTVYLEAVVHSPDNKFYPYVQLLDNIGSQAIGYRFPGNYDWPSNFSGGNTLIVGTGSTNARIQAQIKPDYQAVLGGGLRINTSWMTSDAWPSGNRGDPA